MKERIQVIVKKGTKDKIYKIAGRQGLSEFIRQAIESKILVQRK